MRQLVRKLQVENERIFFFFFFRLKFWWEKDQQVHVCKYILYKCYVQICMRWETITRSKRDVNERSKIRARTPSPPGGRVYLTKRMRPYKECTSFRFLLGEFPSRSRKRRRNCGQPLKKNPYIHVFILFSFATPSLLIFTYFLFLFHSSSCICTILPKTRIKQKLPTRSSESSLKEQEEDFV